MPTKMSIILLQRDIHRMQRTGAALRAGQGHVQRLRGEALFLLLRLQLGGALLQRLLQRLTHVVDQLADSWAAPRRAACPCRAAVRSARPSCPARRRESAPASRKPWPRPFPSARAREFPAKSFPLRSSPSDGSRLTGAPPLFCKTKSSAPSSGAKHSSAVPPRFAEIALSLSSI